jgi:hypothetical protein
VLALGERLDQRGQQVEELGREIRDQAELVHTRAAEIIERVDVITPLVERGVGFATPLEGTVERVGRAVDRLPGGRRRPPAKKPAAKPKPKPKPKR